VRTLAITPTGTARETTTERRRRSGRGKHTIVTAILYVEVFITPVNGALLHLAFRNTKPVQLSAEERVAILEQLKQTASKR